MKSVVEKKYLQENLDVNIKMKNEYRVTQEEINALLRKPEKKTLGKMFKKIGDGILNFLTYEPESISVIKGTSELCPDYTTCKVHHYGDEFLLGCFGKFEDCGYHKINELARKSLQTKEETSDKKDISCEFIGNCRGSKIEKINNQYCQEGGETCGIKAFTIN